MKKSICIISILFVVIILSGCNNEKNNDLKDVDETFAEIKNENMTEKNVIKEQIKNNDVVQEYSEDDLSEKLGEINKSDNQVLDNLEKELSDDCDEGFIYHTELEECFKVGGIIDSKDDKVEIDPVVQECNDSGGIYNAQIEKCFID